MANLEVTYRESFERAEHYLKEAEFFVGPLSPRDIALGGSKSGVLVPSINELRYAGRHAAQALRDGADVNAEYEDAIRHCNRACFDAIDAQIQYILAECRRFCDDYGRVVVSTIINDYGADKAWINKFKEELSANVLPKEDRWRWLDWLESNLPKLRAINSRWDCGREELNKMLEEVNSARWHRTVNTVLAVIVAAATVVGTILAVAVYLGARH
ncbi:MAG: hypothetical protein ACRC46_00260 [Thermoguttaceae bacterium]